MLRALIAAAMVVAAAGAAAAATPQEDYEKGLAAYEREDVMAAMEALERAAAMDYAPAQVLLAHILDKADEDARALELYRRAADQGDAAGELGLGGMYAAGEGVERDVEQALVWISKSAERGHGPAILVIAEAYAKGQLGLPRDQARAVEWLQRGVDAGYEPARMALEALSAGKPPAQGAVAP